MSWISKKNLVSKNISGGVKDCFRYDWKMECCQCLLIFTHSIGSRSYRKESNDCTKFGLSNFNVLCFVTLLYVFFLVKSDLLSFHGKDTSYMLQHRFDVFRYCVFFLSLLDFSWIFFCSNIVLRGFQTLSVVFTYLDVVNTRHAFLVLQNI